MGYGNGSMEAACEYALPGRYCPNIGMTSSLACPPGSYSSANAEICTKCPLGQYQEESSGTKCDLCPAGRYGALLGSANHSECFPCQAGKIAEKPGSSNCTLCPIGFFQSQINATGCISCVKHYADHTLISNADRTGCESNPNLLGLTLVEVMFGDSLASWVTTFVVVMPFMMLAGTMTYMREREPRRLANYSRIEAAFNSFCSGFFFIIEVLLVIAMWPGSDLNKGLSAILAISRLVHTFAGIFVVTALFGRDRLAKRLDKYLPGIYDVRELVDTRFARENVYLVETVALFSFCDVCMLQFMPWKASHFYKISEGYPCIFMLKMLASIKTGQSVVAVTTELIYLGANNFKERNINIWIFFYMNIIFGLITVAIDALLLCLRGNILVEDEKVRILVRERRKKNEKNTKIEKEKASKA